MVDKNLWSVSYIYLEHLGFKNLKCSFVNWHAQWKLIVIKNLSIRHILSHFYMFFDYSVEIEIVISNDQSYPDCWVFHSGFCLH